MDKVIEKLRQLYKLMGSHPHIDLFSDYSGQVIYRDGDVFHDTKIEFNNKKDLLKTLDSLINKFTKHKLVDFLEEETEVHKSVPARVEVNKIRKKLA